MQPEKARQMSGLSPSPTWRSFIGAITVAGAFGIFLLALQRSTQTSRNIIAEDSPSNSLPAKPPAATEDKTVRPFYVRSHHKSALPVIITHGWPGSVIEQLKIIGPQWE